MSSNYLSPHPVLTMVSCMWCGSVWSLLCCVYVLLSVLWQALGEEHHEIAKASFQAASMCCTLQPKTMSTLSGISTSSIAVGEIGCTWE